MTSEKNNIQHIVRQLIFFFRDKERKTDQQQLDVLWADVKRRAEQEKSTKRRRLFISIASSAAILLGAFLLIKNMGLINTDYTDIRKIIFADDLHPYNVEDITLITSNNQEFILEQVSEITCSDEGTISFKSGKIVPKRSEEKANGYNKLIVPKGKRIQVILSDSSKLWINSGTQVIFPTTFDGEKREIFADGEIYLDVTRDTKKPFIVKTDNFDVKVLGTSFNICTYKELVPSVALINGHVMVEDNKGGKAELQPNQLVTIEENGIGKKREVNAAEYAGWTENLLILRAESVENVLKRLSIYYNATFEVDEAVKHLPISGKLDLKNDIKDIIRIISKTVPITYTEKNGKLIITKQQLK
ncbi:hypothetical protein GGR21_000054 [Dysgonomonas hofstadii]|uniref:FecR family protein n=1 Tax=Dysgonomonas hofstadii TaxID=637886 RepID=A0A840CHN4_9BACT|nr:FecR domain-containing protein [Dysgonomonas hofstadii]MBB4034169.1 hypothetical protein [Dysgonomonas hofstadii]